MNKTHTPLPWRIGEERKPGEFTIRDTRGTTESGIIAYGVLPHNTELIVKAVNSHDRLVEALRLTTEALELARDGEFDEARQVCERSTALLAELEGGA